MTLRSALTSLALFLAPYLHVVGPRKRRGGGRMPSLSQDRVLSAQAAVHQVQVRVPHADQLRNIGAFRLLSNVLDRLAVSSRPFLLPVSAANRCRCAECRAPRPGGGATPSPQGDAQIGRAEVALDSVLRRIVETASFFRRARLVSRQGEQAFAQQALFVEEPFVRDRAVLANELLVG